MQATVNIINERLKNAPQEVLDQLLTYLDDLERNNTIPQWQQDVVIERKKTDKDSYLSLDDLDKKIKLH